MSISEAQSIKPMCMTTPPGFTAASAALRVALPPTASITKSMLLSAGPEPAIGSYTATSATLAAEARRSALVSATVTCRTP